MPAIITVDAVSGINVGGGATGTPPGLSSVQVLWMTKMIMVPENSSDDHFTEEEILRIRGTLRDELCKAENPILLRIIKSYHE